MMRMSCFAQWIAAALVLWAGSAHATGTINAAGMTISPLTVNTGTYTAPTVPSPQSVTFTISGTYNTNAAGGTCSLALSFQRATYPPATMAISGGGGSTLPYTITSASGGGNTLLFAGNTVSLANVQQFSFASAGASLTNRAFTSTVTSYAAMTPATSQTGGSYSDSLTMYVFDISTGGSVAGRGFTVNGTVAKSCTIGGLAKATDTATIPITAAGNVNTAAINKSYANVACNTPSNVQLTTQNGGVTTATTGSASFTNIIDYSASATFSGATATLNTATNPAAAGPETGTAVSTTGTQPNGTMTVTITPQLNTKTLIGGTYADTLSIIITPQ